VLKSYVTTSYALDNTLHAICYHHVENQRGSLVILSNNIVCLLIISLAAFVGNIIARGTVYDGSRCTTPVPLAIILPTNAASEIMSRQTMLFDKITRDPR
ncbi:hypothetical protein SFRURICE_017431, partial [Spodoptera frugiperda]